MMPDLNNLSLNSTAYASSSSTSSITCGTSSGTTNLKKRKGEFLEGKSKKICEAMLKRLHYQPLLEPKEIPYNLGEPINLSREEDVAARRPLSEMATNKYKENLPYIIALLEGDHEENGKITKRVQEIHDGCSLASERQSPSNSGMGSSVVPRKITYFINYERTSEHCYLLGKEKKLHKPKYAAFFNLLIAANNGDYQSQYNLALHYEKAEGFDRERSQKEAFRYMKNCAEKPVSDDLKETHKKAMLRLAHYYYEGIGVEKDQAQALDLYKKSAMSGSFVGMSFLFTTWARSFFSPSHSGKQVSRLSAEECGNSVGMQSFGNAMFKRFHYQPLLDPKEKPYNLSAPINLSTVEDLAFIQPLSEMATDKHKENLPYIIALLEGDHKENGKITKRVQEIHDGCSLAYWRQAHRELGMVSWIVPRKITYFINYDPNSEYCYLLGKEKKLRKPKHAAFFNLLIAANNGDYQAQYKLALHYAQAEGLGKERNLKEAFRYLKNFAEATVGNDLKENHNEAMLRLAEYYRKGIGVEKDLTQAFNWCKKSAEVGNPVSMWDLGYCFQNGIGIDKDFVQAFSWYKKSAQAGNFAGMNSLGYCFKEGTGVEKNLSQAFDWFKKSAEGGNFAGMSNLGHCYQFGQGTEKDFAQAFKWIEKSAEGGNLAGMNSLGYYLQNGIGVDKDLVQAFNWYKKSATGGNSSAMNNLGHYFQSDAGIEKDLAQSIKWFKKSAEAGNSMGMNNLGYCFQNGIGVDKDFALAFKWFKKSAKVGNSEGMCNLGYCFQNGLGVDKDFALAFKWIEMSAAGGNLAGMNSLGYCFKEGTGVEKDLTQAVNWFKKSAEGGNFAGMNSLGYCFKEGTGVEKDLTQAVNWFKESAEGGNFAGMSNLGSCFKEGTGVEKDLIQAFNLFKKGAEGNSTAMYNLAHCFKDGTGVEKDIVQAFKLFKKDADCGSYNSLTCMAICLLENFDSLRNCEGIPQNKIESEKLAIQWLEKASKVDGNATYLLGLCYLQGRGVEVNLKQGKQLLMISYKATPSLTIIYSLKSLSETHPELFTADDNPQDYPQLYDNFIKEASKDQLQRFIEILSLGKRFPQDLSEAQRLNSILSEQS